MIVVWSGKDLGPSLIRFWKDVRRYRLFFILDPRAWVELIGTAIQARLNLWRDRQASLPVTKQDILNLSVRYQEEWRFERERLLMEHAQRLFPDWDYARLRLEWHARPAFHRDPEKSKTQPRERIAAYDGDSPALKDSTMETLCFVVAAGSDEPYFSLAIQLLESIKATRRFSETPIKVLDCGLTDEDIAYLVRRFEVTVKDPGWDVDPGRIRRKGDLKPGWKAAVSRAYIHRHFPGYEFYFWIDTDTWVQDERAIARYIRLAEDQGLGVGAEYPCYSSWSEASTDRTAYYHSLPPGYARSLEGKKAVINSVYCIRRDFAETLAREYALMMNDHEFVWGTCLTILNYAFHKHIQGGVILTNPCLNDDNTGVDGVNVCLDDQKRMTFDGGLLGFVGLEWYLKSLPLSILFANATLDENLNAMGMSRQIHRTKPIIAQEMMHIFCERHGWRQGSVFYRTYSSPSRALHRE